MFKTMKKFIMMVIAVIAMAFTTANAEVTKTGTYEGNKLTDNVSVGLSAGVYTPLKGSAFFGSMRPVINLQVTKYFNPVFGFGVEGQTFINAKGAYHSCTVPYMTNVSGLAYVNATNLFFGYTGAPRTLEVEAVYGLGWGHVWNKGADNDLNYMTSKAGLNLNWNFDKSKSWTLSLRPAVVWNLDAYKGVENHNTHYDINSATFELTAGLAYHFKGSNGKPYMTYAALYDQAEVDRLNAEINELRAVKPETIYVEKKIYVDGGTAAGKAKTVNKYVIYFSKGSSEITEAAKETLKVIPAGATVDVLGCADEVSSEAFNQKLSERRANAVAKYLADQGYKVDTVTATGETGDIVARVVVVSTK